MDGLTVLKRSGRMKWLKLTAVTRGPFFVISSGGQVDGTPNLPCIYIAFNLFCDTVCHTTYQYPHARIHTCMHALRCVALRCTAVCITLHYMTWHDITLITLYCAHVPFMQMKFSNIRDDVTCVHVICLVYKYLIGACVSVVGIL